MSPSTLLASLAAIVLLQSVVLTGIAWSRQRRGVRALRTMGDAPIGNTHGSHVRARVAWHGLRAFRVTEIVAEDAAGTVRSYTLVPVDGRDLPPYLPGQYLTFELQVPDATGRSRTEVRCYSLSDRPQADHYRITVKRIGSPPQSPSARPGVASTHFHDGVHAGSVLQARAPAGHFTLDAGNLPLVLVAGGIGITPLRAILEALLASGTSRQITLFHGVRNGNDHLMKVRLEELARRHANFRLIVCYSRPLASDRLGADYQALGHVDIGLLRQNLPLREHRFYVCGPRAMLEELVPGLRDWGVADDSIAYEAFGQATVERLSLECARASDAARREVRAASIVFARSGKRAPWVPGTGSLLDFARSHGIAMASGCRAGGCGSCQTVIEAGEVEYAQRPEFDPEIGTCLLCIARPKTDLTLAA